MTISLFIPHQRLEIGSGYTILLSYFRTLAEALSLSLSLLPPVYW